MPRVFISYRRHDSADVTGRIADRLVGRFGKEQVFIDIDAIRPGADFVMEIEQAVADCNVLVAVIGRSWLEAIEGDDMRRTDDPLDYVTLEIAAALTRNVPIVPVLVGGATMPRAEELAAQIRPLARRNALEIRHAGFHQAVDMLIETIERQTEVGPMSTSPTPTQNLQPPYIARIEDLDRVLEMLLQRELSADLLPQVSISFERPDDQFPPSKIYLPAINFFLYDIDQQADENLRNPSSTPVTYSYLATAYSSDASPTNTADEHRLLSEVMNVFARYATVPDSVVEKAVSRPEARLPTILIHPSKLPNAAAFWQALGARPKAALSYTVTVLP